MQTQGLNVNVQQATKFLEDLDKKGLLVECKLRSGRFHRKHCLALQDELKEGLRKGYFTATEQNSPGKEYRRLLRRLNICRRCENNILAPDH